MNRFLRFLNELNDLGAGELDEISIPRVAVIGNQSSGKSSLVEEICGIQVPRQAGTCTRCPMRCVVNQSEGPWRAELFIEVDGRRCQFGPELNDRGEVELWMLRAQAAILNPQIEDLYFFRNKSRDQVNSFRDTNPEMLEFSSSVLHVQIYGESVALEFIDLPGLIHNAANPSLPGEVRELVNHYISDEFTLILVAMPVLDDLQNQEAFQLAANFDSERERTLGVLTKPDTLPPTSTGLQQRWRTELDNPTTFLGFFCVRLRDDTERSLSEAQFLRVKKAVFTEMSPWKDVRDRSRLGVKKLVSHISMLLAQRVKERLPTLLEDVQAAISRCEVDIAAFPPLLELPPPAALHDLISEYSNMVSETLTANGNRESGVVRQNIMEYKSFKTKIAATRPFLTSALIPAGEFVRVSRLIEEHRGFELSPHFTYDVVKVLMHEFVSLWQVPQIELFSMDCKRVLRYLEKVLIPRYFDRFPNLKIFVRNITKNLFESRREMTEEKLEGILDLETLLFFTVEDGTIIANRTRWLQSIHNQSSNYAQEREIMATVLTYFDIASKRFVDYVMLSLEVDLHRSLAKALRPTLFQNLAEASVDHLMSEDPQIERKRRMLTEKLEKLRSIERRVSEFHEA